MDLLGEPFEPSTAALREGVPRPAAGAARHRAARLHEVTRQGDHPVLAHQVPGGVHALDDEGRPEDVREDPLVVGVVVDEVAREVDHPRV